MSNDYKEGVVSLERGIYLGRDLKGVWDFDEIGNMHLRERVQGLDMVAVVSGF